MGKDSKIEWTDHTFNPWIGCTKVSDGCKHCYAETLMDHRYGKVEWGPQGTRVRTSPQNWRKPIKWNEEAAMLGVRKKVFCASLADVFEIKDDQPELDKWRFDLFVLIEDTPNLDWLLLTKRPENVAKFLSRFDDYDLPGNVWVGTSVENQEQANKRIPELLKIPASTHFLSMEPLLGRVNISEIRAADDLEYLPLVGTTERSNKIDWVIVGGESGQNARPMHPDWVRSIRDQCVDAGVPFLFKQWGAWLFEDQRVAGYDGHEKLFGELGHDKFSNKHLKHTDKDVGAMACRSKHRIYTNGGFNFYRVGKKRSGRLLDGREWNEIP